MNKINNQNTNLNINLNEKEILSKFSFKLKSRGIRGIMSLHKQFLTTCNNLEMITFNDFIKVLKLQRLDLSKSESEKLFENFSIKENLNQNQNQNFDFNLNKINLLNFPRFIREFKKVLNSKRLKCIENVFAILDEDNMEMLCIDDLKIKFNIKNHPEIIKNGRSEDEILLEFVDSLDIYCANLVNFFLLIFLLKFIYLILF